MSTNPELSIIIVNWNGIEFLPNCLKSIVVNPPSLSFEIVVVDNASNDGSSEWLRSKESANLLSGTPFRLIESRDNLGFGRANNLAVHETRSPFIFFLNPDTVVKGNAIQHLIDGFKSDSRIGMTAPRLLHVDGTLQASVWVHPPTPTIILLEGLALYRLLPKKVRAKWLRARHWNHDEKIAVPAVSGAAMMVQRTMIEEIGAFAPDIHMFGEDAELCVRMQKNGWKILFVPDAEITHLGGQSSLQRWGSTITRLKETEALIAFQNRCLSPGLVVLNTFTSAVVLAVHFVKAKFKKDDTAMLGGLLKLHVAGFKTAFARVFRTKQVHEV